MADFWNIGNTTVRNPERIIGALRIFQKYYDGEKSFSANQKQQGEFFEKLLNHNTDGNLISKNDKIQIPIYTKQEKTTSMDDDEYNQKNGRMYLSAMDEIGFTNAYESPAIVTSSGKVYLKYPELESDIWLRQLLKYQIPNHQKTINEANLRPGFVLLKLILELDGLTKFELGLANLIKSENLVEITETIQNYRKLYVKAKKENKITNLECKFMTKQILEYFSNEYESKKKKLQEIIQSVKTKHLSGDENIETKLTEIFALGKGGNTPKAKDSKKQILNLINGGDFMLENHETVLKNYFLAVKSATIWSDYVDLNRRYLMMCRMVHWYQKDQEPTKLVVLDEYKELVKSAIYSLGPMPKVSTTEEKDTYKKYLNDVNHPKLNFDDKSIITLKIGELIQKLQEISKDVTIIKQKAEFISDDRLIYNRLFQRLQLEKESYFAKTLDKNKIKKELEELTKKPKAITPTKLESLIWQAILSLGGYRNHPSWSRNFHVDSNYESIFTAAGDRPDMKFNYGIIHEIVEVTKNEGISQWKAEKEPVPRHIATHKFFNKKESRGLFIAPTIDKSTQDQFYLNSSKKLSEIVKEESVEVNIVTLSFQQFYDVYIYCIESKFSEKSWLKILNELHSLIDDAKNQMNWAEKIDCYVRNLSK